MIKAIIFDFSRTLLFPVDRDYKESLNDLYKSVKDSYNFKFFDYFYFNKELLEFAGKIRNNLRTYIFTTDSIQEDLQIKDVIDKHFIKVFSAKDIHLDKNDIKSYQFIISELGFKPDEIVFVDDSDENVQTAKKAGINTIKYAEFDKFIQRLQELGAKV